MDRVGCITIIDWHCPNTVLRNLVLCICYGVFNDFCVFTNDVFKNAVLCFGINNVFAVLDACIDIAVVVRGCVCGSVSITIKNLLIYANDRYKFSRTSIGKVELATQNVAILALRFSL